MYSSNSSSAFLSVKVITSSLSAISERASDKVRSSSTTPFIAKQRGGEKEMWQFVVGLYSGFLIRKRVIKQRMGEGLAEDLWLNVGRRGW